MDVKSDLGHSTLQMKVDAKIAPLSKYKREGGVSCKIDGSSQLIIRRNDALTERVKQGQKQKINKVSRAPGCSTLRRKNMRSDKWRNVVRSHNILAEARRRNYFRISPPRSASPSLSAAYSLQRHSELRPSGGAVSPLGWVLSFANQIFPVEKHPLLFSAPQLPVGGVGNIKRAGPKPEDFIVSVMDGPL